MTYLSLCSFNDFYPVGTLIVLTQGSITNSFLVVGIDPWTKKIGVMAKDGSVSYHTSTDVTTSIQNHGSDAQIYSPNGTKRELTQKKGE